MEPVLQQHCLIRLFGDIVVMIINTVYLPDVNEFLSQSGWFSFPGLAHGKQALQHVLAKKMKLSHEVFLGIREAVYLLEYRQGEKVRL